MGKIVAYVMTCRWGKMPLEATEENAAIAEAVRYAVKYGVAVVVSEAEGRELVFLPPAPQTDAALALITRGYSCFVPAGRQSRN